MQKQNVNPAEVALVPIPWALLDEINLDPMVDAIQFSIRRGRIIVEPLDGDENRICIGACCRCPAKRCCEACRE